MALSAPRVVGDQSVRLYASDMRWFLRRSRIRERACLQCGERWTASRASPSGWSRGFAEHRLLSVSDAGIGYMLAGTYRQNASADRELETLEQWRKCPTCGSDGQYTQRAVS